MGAPRAARAMRPLQGRAMELVPSMEPITMGLRLLHFALSHSTRLLPGDALLLMRWSGSCTCAYTICFMAKVRLSSSTGACAIFRCLRRGHFCAQVRAAEVHQRNSLLG